MADKKTQRRTIVATLANTAIGGTAQLLGVFALNIDRRHHAV
jgi:hypothetical protein